MSSVRVAPSIKKWGNVGFFHKKEHSSTLNNLWMLLNHYRPTIFSTEISSQTIFFLNLVILNWLTLDFVRKWLVLKIWLRQFLVHPSTWHHKCSMETCIIARQISGHWELSSMRCFLATAHSMRAAWPISWNILTPFVLIFRQRLIK